MNIKFAERLKRAMRDKGMSVKQLSDKSGVASHTIYAYMNPDSYKWNARNPTMINFESLCDVLEVSMDWLWGRTDGRT